MPDCSNDIFSTHTQRLLGQLAHIVARKYTGPRGDPHHPESKLHSAENLMLLCAHHHQQIDSNVPEFSVEHLQNLKQRHESRIARILAEARPWRVPWSIVYYLNIPRIAMLAALQGVPLPEISIPRFAFLHELDWELAPVLYSFSTILERASVSAIPLKQVTRITSDLCAGIFSFSSSCWKKNIPSQADLTSEYKLAGTFIRDPYIYFRHKGTTVVVAINPKWITTATSFNDLTGPGKTATLDGLVQLKKYDARQDSAVFTPIIFGQRQTDVFCDYQ
ncbi:MAG TPA: HNH endonuclease [Thermoanaerobaculia bacterium]|nr:HNH endonuclease [Thermoanaerobaculia bacterium]